jgi:hypothetical protein
MTPDQRARDFTSQIPDLRDRYELAYEIFRGELPREISTEATALLRQLTDPDPTSRELAVVFQRLPRRWDLQWLLRKIDILTKRLTVDRGLPPRRRKVVTKP